MNPLIETKSITIDYPHIQGILRLYSGLSFKMEKDDFIAVLGGSGWGKSTLVNIILGLEQPTTGSIQFDGRNVTRDSFVKRCSLVRTAAVFQRPTALPQLTVIQNLALALSIAGVSRKEAEERIGEALAFFGLERIARSYPDALSAGQRRRIDLARALAIKPQLLVLDEPTGDLDPPTSNLVTPLLRGLNKDQGAAIFMTTALPRLASAARHQIQLKPPSIMAPEKRMVDA